MLFLLEYCDALRVEGNVENLLFTSYQLALDELESHYGNPPDLESLDPEIDRICIWRLDDAKPILLWHFSGTEYEQDANDLRHGGVTQGILPGHKMPLWEETVNFRTKLDNEYSQRIREARRIYEQNQMGRD